MFESPDQKLERIATELKDVAFEHPWVIGSQDAIRQLKGNADPTDLVRAGALNRIHPRHVRQIVVLDWEIQIQFTYTSQIGGGACHLFVASCDLRPLPDRIAFKVRDTFFGGEEAVREITQPEDQGRQFVMILPRRFR